jgi:hypothetical protein
MIAAPVVPPREIDKLPASARRAGQPRQSAQPVGHLPVMIAIREHRPRLAHGRAHPGNERLADRHNRGTAATTPQY